MRRASAGGRGVVGGGGGGGGPGLGTNSIFFCFLFVKKIIGLPVGKINDPLSGNHYSL